MANLGSSHTSHRDILQVIDARGLTITTFLPSTGTRSMQVRARTRQRLEFPLVSKKTEIKYTRNVVPLSNSTTLEENTYRE